MAGDFKQRKDHTWLESYLKREGIEGEIGTISDVQTVEKAAKRLNCRKKQIFKSIVFVAEDGSGVVGVVDGESRVDKSKLENIVGKKLRVADRKEVFKLTGFTAGGVSPFGTGCMVFVDRGVMDEKIVYGGGGDENHLLRIDSKELLKVAKIADLATK